METEVTSINWVISGIVGIISSVIGAFIFWGFQKLAVGHSSKRHAQKIEDLIKQKEKLSKLHENTSDLLIYFLGLLFYILAISFVGSALAYLTYFIEFPINILRMSLYFGAAFLALKAFSDLAKLKSFETTVAKIDQQIALLRKSSPNKSMQD